MDWLDRLIGGGRASSRTGTTVSAAGATSGKNGADSFNLCLLSCVMVEHLPDIKKCEFFFLGLV